MPPAHGSASPTANRSNKSWNTPVRVTTASAASSTNWCIANCFGTNDWNEERTTRMVSGHSLSGRSWSATAARLFGRQKVFQDSPKERASHPKKEQSEARQQNQRPRVCDNFFPVRTKGGLNQVPKHLSAVGESPNRNAGQEYQSAEIHERSLLNDNAGYHGQESADAQDW